MSALATAAAPAATGSRRADAAATLQLVGFRLGQEEYGIEILKVREIILVGAVTRVPQPPPYLRGLINLRGTVIPIVDLRTRFGMPAAADNEATRIVVCTCEGQTIGFVVDSVSEVMRVPRDQIAPPPAAIAGLRQKYITGLVRLDKRLMILLDVERLFAAGESAELQKLGQ